MKQYMKLLPVLALGMVVESCVDDALLPYSVQKPTSVAQYEYLNNYDVLKSYLDRAKNPNFKLGLAASVSDFVQQGVVYEAVTINFDEMTAGNAMKYASVVADDGTMNFSTVSNFVDVAKAAGITIYGHTLGWHAQQNMTYLNGLIADKEITVDPGDAEEVNDVYVDYSTLGSYTYWHGDKVDASINSDGNLLIHNPEAIENFYEIQYHVANGLVASPDIEYTVTAKIKASGDGYLTCCIGDWGGQQTAALSFTTEWQEVKLTFTGVNTADGFVMFQSGNFAGDIEIEWLKVTHKEAPSIPLTPEEKKDTLTWALDNWVKGMMEATGGYVTAWDLANETVSGVDNDGDGFYDLQSSENGDPTTNFYWTDYLGDIDYVRILESRARKYFKEYGGDPSKLKLFINDFNLESWWDGNQKVKSLVEWIRRWESDGVTKIDGIGTQMHVSYILNEADQKAQEDAIVNMFKILAESGKLIKISELDMGIVDKAFGTAIKTENVTYEQQLKMAEFYQFIISKYFEIIPVEQQYGITQWCATDSPADSGWRPGEPTGLWDSSFKRKPTYAGFANGLAGKVIAEPSEELSQEK